MDIKQFKLKPELTHFLKSKNFNTFLPVQNRVIPLLMKQKSVLVEAPTGTGKTLSFLLPIINNINFESSEIQAVIFVPTRELAKQIWGVAKEIQKYLNFSILLAVGGEQKDEQIRKLNNKPNLIIATPERLELINQKSSVLYSNLKFVCIDEADMIIDFGFWTEINSFFSKYVKTQVSTSLYSATLNESLMNFASKKISGKVERVIIKKSDEKQVVNLISLMDFKRENRLMDILKSDKFNPYFAIIFVKSNDEVEKIYNFLKSNGIKNIMQFNSNLTQRQRDKVIKAIRNKDIIYLVTTDLMARGLDFEGVTHIINYTLPVDLNYYRHRIGRTNRGKSRGQVYEIYSIQDQEIYEKIQKKNEWIKFEKLKL